MVAPHGEIVVGRDRECQWSFLGQVAYHEAWALQRRLAEARIQNRVGDMVLLLEHPPVYTLGRSSRAEDLLAPTERLEAQGAQVVSVDRGGQVTFHGPGQLVAYPIIDLRAWGGGPLRYVRALEEAAISVVGAFGIAAGRVEKLTGVWVAGEKIAAIGVKISRGVTTHGLALNVSTDLAWFQHIVPCGVGDRGVTSLERLLGRRVGLEEVVPAMAEQLGEKMGFRMRQVSPASVLGLAQAAPAT